MRQSGVRLFGGNEFFSAGFNVLQPILSLFVLLGSRPTRAMMCPLRPFQRRWVCNRLADEAARRTALEHAPAHMKAFVALDHEVYVRQRLIMFVSFCRPLSLTRR